MKSSNRNRKGWIGNMSVGYRIYKKIKRLDNSLIEAYTDIPVTNIGDASNRLYCLAGNIKSLNHRRAVGIAYTVSVSDGDNLLFYYAIDNAQPGDIIVVSGNGLETRALCGEIMALFAHKRQLGGFVVDGAVRDRVALQNLPFPVFARNVSPNGPYKNGPGEVNVPIVVDGRVVNPGDLIIADEEGIAIINPKDADEVLENAREVMRKEERVIEAIHKNGALDLTWMYEKLKKDACSIIDDYYAK